MRAIRGCARTFIGEVELLLATEGAAVFGMEGVIDRVPTGVGRFGVDEEFTVGGGADTVDFNVNDSDGLVGDICTSCGELDAFAIVDKLDCEILPKPVSPGAAKRDERRPKSRTLSCKTDFDPVPKKPALFASMAPA